MVTINIQKKDLYLITGIFVFLIATGFVIAYGGTQPSVMGHSNSELQVTGTIVGGCSYICDKGEGPTDSFRACTYKWGYSTCDSAAGMCTNTGWPDGGRCHCTKGTATYIGTFYAWDPSGKEYVTANIVAGGTNPYFFGMQRNYLCIT